ncbi:MAG: translation elongation factor Ts [Rhodanobacteraceae bacterium]
MEITAQQVKELRERSGAGMMECKKALTENQGNIEAAMESLRKTGLAKADKKAGRVAAEGRIALARNDTDAVLVEVNCETDFVAKDENFLTFAAEVAKTALAGGAADIEALKSSSTSHGKTVEEGRQWLVAKVGENVQLRRLARIDGAATLGDYVHGGRIGVLVDMKGGNADLARGIAMHIAAMNPPYLDADKVPADIVARERDIALAQAKDSGKPPEILEKMIQGKLRKTIGQMTLLGQEYAGPDSEGQSVADMLKSNGAEVLAFHRLAVGEGIEKQDEDFAAEVMKQAGLA